MGSSVLASTMPRACSPRSTPALRGMMWKWTWKTLWPAGAPFSMRQHDAGRVQAFLHRLGDLLRGRHHRGRAVGRQVQNIFRRLLGDHQHMAVGLGHHIHEGEGLVVLDRLSRREFRRAGFWRRCCWCRRPFNLSFLNGPCRASSAIFSAHRLALRVQEIVHRPAPGPYGR